MGVNDARAPFGSALPARSIGAWDSAVAACGAYTPAVTAARLSVREIGRRLAQVFGTHTWRPDPALGPLEEVVGAIISQHTSGPNSRRAYERLRARFPTWEDVREAPLEGIQEAIWCAGLARLKAPRLKALLAQVTAERGALDLGFLEALSPAEAMAWLRHLPGVGQTTAACVLLFGMGRPVMPVDGGILRVSRRLGLIAPRGSADEAQRVLEGGVEPGEVLHPAPEPDPLRTRALHPGRPGLPRLPPERPLRPLQRPVFSGPGLYSRPGGEGGTSRGRADAIRGDRDQRPGASAPAGTRGDAGGGAGGRVRRQRGRGASQGGGVRRPLLHQLRGPPGPGGRRRGQPGPPPLPALPGGPGRVPGREARGHREADGRLRTRVRPDDRRRRRGGEAADHLPPGPLAPHVPLPARPPAQRGLRAPDPYGVALRGHAHAVLLRHRALARDVGRGGRGHPDQPEGARPRPPGLPVRPPGGGLRPHLQPVPPGASPW